jgi:acetylornithine deacetylase/succinyl-diaminopimelate desuccinylase-like protein
MSFPSSNRKKRRITLYGTLAIVVGLLLTLTWILSRPTSLDKDQEWTQIDYASLPEVELLRRYIQVDTSPTTGSELAGAEFLAAELEKMGITAHIERFGDSGANLWAILEGESPEALVLHNHIDVYPVRQPERWLHEPYAGELDQAWLYGRGAFDMKSVAATQLLAIKDLMDLGRKPKRSVIFLATGSEERGSELGTRWILEQHPELSKRFWAVLTEGGVVEPISRTTIKYWGVEFSQKRFAHGYFCAETQEELAELGRAILDWGSVAEELLLVPEVELFARAYADSRDDDLYRTVLANPRRALVRADEFAQLPPYLKSLFRNEAVPIPPEADPEGGYRMRIIFHLLPGQELESTMERLLPPWLLHGTTLTLGEPLGATSASSPDHPVYKALTAAVLRAYPDSRVGPYFVSWSATDSRFFRENGIPSYGFSPFLIFSTDTLRVDGPNERISLPGYMSGFELYRDAVREIVG